MLLRLGERTARREAEIDLDLAEVGDDVACHTAGDADRVESLAVDETVDGDLAGAVLREASEDRRGTVDRVVPHPRAGGVRACAVGAHDGAERPVASPLDLPVGRFAENREVACEEVRPRAGEDREAVARGVDFFVVVPHPGDVDPRI